MSALALLVGALLVASGHSNDAHTAAGGVLFFMAIASFIGD